MSLSIILLFFFGLLRADCPLGGELSGAKLEGIVPGIHRVISSKASGGFFLIVSKEEIPHVVSFRGEIFIRCFVKMEVNSNELWVFEKDERGLFKRCSIEETQTEGPQLVIGFQKKKLNSSDLVMLPPETMSSMAVFFDIQESMKDFSNIYNENEYCILVFDSQEENSLTIFNFEVVIDVGEFTPTNKMSSIHDTSSSIDYFSSMVETQSALISRFLTFDCLSEKCYIFKALNKVFITSVHIFKKDSQNFNGIMTIYLMQVYFKPDELFKFTKIGEEFSSMEMNRAAYSSDPERKGYMESPEGSSLKAIFSHISQGLCGELGVTYELLSKTLNLLTVSDAENSLAERLENMAQEVNQRVGQLRSRFVFGKSENGDGESVGSDSHFYPRYSEKENEGLSSALEFFNHLPSEEFSDEDESGLKWYFKLLIGLAVSIIFAGVVMATYVIAT